MKIPRQVLIKAGLDYVKASQILKQCESHPASKVYEFFITNNMGTNRENWGIYARVRGMEGFKDAELTLD